MNPVVTVTRWLKNLFKKKQHVHKWEFQYHVGPISNRTYYHKCECGQRAFSEVGHIYTLIKDNGNNTGNH